MAKITADYPMKMILGSDSVKISAKVIPKTKNINKIELSFEKTLSDLQKTWSTNTAKTKELVPKLPSEYRPLFELQQSIYKCHLQTEIITIVGDSVQSTLKKLQNQGG